MLILFIAWRFIIISFGALVQIKVVFERGQVYARENEGTVAFFLDSDVILIVMPVYV